MSRNTSSISIVTAAKNASATIVGCVKSVQQQTYPAEHIIVEGSSTHRTAMILDNNLPHGARVIYDPASGLYDAINKGLAAAAGDIIGTLNADDVYAHGDVLSRVAQIFNDRPIDACYGDLIYVSASNPSRVVRYWKSAPYRKALMFNGWMPPHPTFFVRRSIYENHGGFNRNLGSAADYELMLRFFMRHHITAAYIPEVMVVMRTGGLSNASLRNRIRANRMDKMAWKINALKPKPWTFAAKPLLKIGQYIFKKPMLGETLPCR